MTPAVAASTDRSGTPNSSVLLTAEEVATRLRLSTWWVYSHAAELGGIKLGAGKRAPLRFTAEGVDDYLARRSTPTPTVVATPPNAAERSQRSTRDPRRRVPLLDAATAPRPE